VAGSDRLTDRPPGAQAVQRGLPPSIGRPGPSPFHRLNPLTKLTLATATALAAIAAGGVIAPALLVTLAILAPAAWAGVLPRLARTALVLSLPIAVSALVVNLFFFPGGETVLLRIGPITASAEGLAFAIEVLARIFALSGAVTLFYLTTRPAELVLDLERRGVSPRIAFVAHASVQTVPAMVQRAAEITDAQRARGLNTEGSPWRRLRGVVPLVGPVILGAIAEVEERTLALEARAFTRPGSRDLLWSPPDSSWQRVVRWGLVAGLVAIVAARVGGVLP